MRFASYLVVVASLAGTPAPAQTVPALPTDQVRLEAFYRLSYRPESPAPATRTKLMHRPLRRHGHGWWQPPEAVREAGLAGAGQPACI